MHVETQSKNGKKYFYLAGIIRTGSKEWKKIRLYLGKNLSKKELDYFIRKKHSELEKKLAEARKKSDILSTLVSEKETRELDKLKNDFRKSKRKMDKLQYQNYYEKFVTEFTYDTNAIEGSTLTLSETALILFDRIVPKGKNIREINEVQNHKDAFDFMLEYRKDITKQFVLHLHKLLMHNILWKYAGIFRDVQVYVRGADFTPTRPDDIEKEFKRMMMWYRRNKKRYHPVVVAAYMHHVFESIHPFRDGNGRVGRLLLNFILRKNGFPMIDIKYKNRQDYYSALNDANKGNMKPLVDLIIKYLKSAEVSI